jgi:hypothetical protein
MHLDISSIQKSPNDRRRNIHLPNNLSKELAEFIGIMVGDGHLRYSVGSQKNGGKLIRSDIVISCNKKEEDYCGYVKNLFKFLFNVELKYALDPRSDSVNLRAHSKGIVQYMHLVCGIPLNQKTNIVSVPKIIKKAVNEEKCAFLRGLADTDFSVTFKNRTGSYNYPVIKGGFKSQTLVRELELLYTELGFKYCVCYNEGGYDKRFDRSDIRHCIYLNGRQNLLLWLSLIGFSNQKILDRINKWKKEGKCPPLSLRRESHS